MPPGSQYQWKLPLFFWAALGAVPPEAGSQPAPPVIPGAGFPAAASSCPENGLELLDRQWLIIEGDCVVNGDIRLRGLSVLVVTDSDFLLRGNMVSNDQGIIFVQRTNFTVDNSVNLQRSITMLGTSILWFSQTVFRSNVEDTGSRFMVYSGKGQSTLMVLDSSVPTENSWLLSRFSERAQLYVARSTEFPSEVVFGDQAKIQLDEGARTATWLPFPAGSQALLVLPDQSSGSVTFRFGRNTPGVVGLGYDFIATNAKLRLGVFSEPGSTVVVVGRGKGFSTNGELSVGYNMPQVTTPQTVSGLRPGYQAVTYLTHQARHLLLLNVDVDPVGWSVYVTESTAPVTVRDSILNEVAAFPGGLVEVENSILQWAVLGSLGFGSSMVVRDSHIYSQVIYSERNGRIELHDTFVHGSRIEAKDDSEIRIVGGDLLASGTVAPCDLANGLTPAGVPRCNPFIGPGVLPAITTTGNGSVVLDGEPPAAVTDMHLVGGTDPAPAKVNEPFTFQAQAGNAGPDAATGVKVLFRTPSQAVVDGFSAGCATSGADVICDVGNLPRFTGSPWLSVTYRALAALTPAVGDISVSTDQADPDPANDRLRILRTIQP